jgi:hypothetical protein
MNEKHMACMVMAKTPMDVGSKPATEPNQEMAFHADGTLEII